MFYVVFVSVLQIFLSHFLLQTLLQNNAKLSDFSFISSDLSYGMTKIRKKNSQCQTYIKPILKKFTNQI